MPHNLRIRLVPCCILALSFLRFGIAVPQGAPTSCPDRPGAFIAPDNPGRYKAAVFDTVSVEKDLVAGAAVDSAGKKVTITLDWYAPEGDPQVRRPALLLIHGGGFKPGTSKSQGYIVTLAGAMAKRGYVCAAIDYRVRTRPNDDWAGTMSDCISDVGLGLKWLRDNAGKYRVDGDHIAVVGGSAGGMIGVNFVAKGRDRRGIFAFVNLWGSPSRQELWPTEIDGCYPPTLIIHGTADMSVPFGASTEFAARLTSAGVKNTLVPLPDAPHTPLMHVDKIIETISAFLFESLTSR